MSRRTKTILSIIAAATIGIGVTFFFRGLRPRRLTSIVGAVLTEDADPRKQAPIADVEITAGHGGEIVRSRSDSSGFFQLHLRTAIRQGATVRLEFRHRDYKRLETSDKFTDKICIVRMAPRAERQVTTSNKPDVLLSDVRVRYVMKNLTVVNVGTMVRAFEVVNTGDVPCKELRPCSPDGKWKAAAGHQVFDAGDRHEFRNPRVSCIAGPCPFTKIEPESLSGNGRVATISVLNWSDTTTFLFEAEVIQAMVGDAIHLLYPAVFGRNMNFTLPVAAQGLSIEAELDGSAIVFPLGPNLRLSWAVCSVQGAPDKAKRYICELKPGYHFR
jgi:hypothetical protein